MASIDIERIDAVVDANGVLAGMLWAFGTPEGIEPNHIWTNVFPGDSSPVWMWLRHSQESLHLRAEWGIYGIDDEIQLGHNGLIVTLGASIPESPLVVQLSDAGWVDFGRGQPPEHIDGLPVVDAMQLMTSSSAKGDFANLLSATIVERFENEPPHEIATLPQETQKSMETFLGQVDQNGAAPPVGSWPVLREGIDQIDRSRFREMRQARRLSFADVRQRLADQTNITVGKDTLSRFEKGTGEPHEPLLPVALDHVLGGNGRLVLAELSSGTGPGAVTVPDFWKAPVWLAFSGDAAEFVVELRWGEWRRRLEGPLPQLVICHSAMAPLRIIADPEVHWTVGVGRRSGAMPINHGWVPASVDTANAALSTYQDALLDAVRHHNDRNTDE
jgi:transcriptional regulator with XRE-family HTH domain